MGNNILKLITVAVFGIAVTACQVSLSGDPAATTGAIASVDPVSEVAPGDFNLATYEQGVNLYASKKCNTCHGSDIATSAKRGINTTLLTAAAGPSSLIAPMRGIILSTEEIAALVYALTQKPPPGVAQGGNGVAQEEAKDPTAENQNVDPKSLPSGFDAALYAQGANLYTVKNCVACHGGEIQASVKRGRHHRKN